MGAVAAERPCPGRRPTAGPAAAPDRPAGPGPGHARHRLVTPTGSPPSPRWRWLARVMVATPVLLVVAATLTRGPLDPRYQAFGGPFDLRGHGGVLLIANQVALAVTPSPWWSLVGRFRRARGVERLQLHWLALAALVVAMAGAAVLAGLAV